MWEGSLFSTPSPAFIVCRLLGNSHSDQRERVPQGRLDLHFSDNEWCWASLHCLLAICMTSLEKCLFSSSARFLNWSSLGLQLSCGSSFYIFLIISSSAALFALTSSHSEGCLFTLLILSFVVQKLLNLIWPYSFTCAILLYNLVLFIYFHYSGRWVIEYPAVIYVRECFAYVCL